MGTRSWEPVHKIEIGDIVYIKPAYFDDPKGTPGNKFSDLFLNSNKALLSGTVQKRFGSTLTVKVHFDGEVCSINIRNVQFQYDDDCYIVEDSSHHVSPASFLIYVKPESKVGLLAQCQADNVAEAGESNGLFFAQNGKSDEATACDVEPSPAELLLYMEAERGIQQIHSSHAGATTRAAASIKMEYEGYDLDANNNSLAENFNETNSYFQSINFEDSKAALNSSSHAFTYQRDSGYRCTVCGKCFTCEKFLTRHNVHCKDHSTSTWYCDICQKGFSRKGTLKIHNDSIHLKINQHECKVCRKKFGRRDNLKMHMVVHTKAKPHQCRTCGKKFGLKQSLKIHERTHTKEIAYRCAVCGKGFIDNSNLLCHMKRHTGEKRFKCTLCTKAFIQNIHLREHMRTHTGERPFKCKVCKKSFSQSNVLVKHMRRHTGERPFKCKICQKAFVQSSNLSKHMKTHADRKPAICFICRRTFTNTRTLGIHRKYKHRST